MVKYRYQEGDSKFNTSTHKNTSISSSKDARADVFLVFEYMEYDINGLLDRKVEFTVPHI